MLPGLMSVTENMQRRFKKQRASQTRLSLQHRLPYPLGSVHFVPRLCSRAHLPGDTNELDPQAGLWVTAERRKVFLDLFSCCDC